MNGKIKFRVWDKKYKCFIPNSKYAICHHASGAFGVMLDDWKTYKAGELLYESGQIFMKYTGLKDWYAGDIGKMSYGTITLIGEIRQAESGEWLIYKDKGNFLSLYDNIDRTTKIGNIYQNPELPEDRNETERIS